MQGSLVARLFEQSRAARWGLTVERFEAALVTSLAHAGDAAAGGPAAAERYLSSLHLEDLGLAAACAAGCEPAWDYFVAEYRALLNRAAAAIDPGHPADLADSIYAELYGLHPKGGERQSLFRYFHGRSRLSTWLRAVLAQRHVDRVRAVRREEPLPDDESELTGGSPGASDEPERSRFVEAMRVSLAAAIADLEPRDRLRLACYYQQDMTLAAIGRMLGEHEATASRHLTRVRRNLRAATEARLRRVHGMDDHAVAECFRSVAEDPGSLDLADLLGTAPGRKNTAPDRSE